MRRRPAVHLAALALPFVAGLGSALAAQSTKAPNNGPRTFDSSFAASAGATGTENPLVQDEVLALGSIAVGTGPNAGTLVRVTNAGSRAMRLGVPLFSGSHANDFAVEVESTALVAAGATALRAPVRGRRGALGPGVALRLEPAGVAELGELHEVVLRGFPLPGLGEATLALRRRPLPIAEDARLVVDGREVAGGLAPLVAELQVWSGQVLSVPGSRVFLMLDAHTAGGFLELPGTPVERVRVLFEGPGRVRLVDARELDGLGLERRRELCARELLVPGHVPSRAHPSLALGVPPKLSECRLAIETDWQLFQLFGATPLVASYVTGLVAAAGEQFQTDVQATLAIAYLGLHSNANDGWTTQETGGGTFELLEEFRAVWGTSWPAEADLAHFLSGAPLGGGIAYVDVLCHDEYGFGVSANLGGDIDWGSWTGAPGDYWDFLVFAHELGHNFGTLHTHDYCPPLDECWDNCNGTTACPRGTLMGYCHLCPGGVSNVDLRFHPVTAQTMRLSIAASCLDLARLGAGDYVQYRVRLNPLFTPGAKSAALSFTHDAGNAPSPFRVQLTGTGL
jgi:hypothetical protein